MSGLGTALATPGLLLCLPAQCRRFFLLYVRAALCRSHGVNDIHLPAHRTATLPLICKAKGFHF